MGALVEKSTEMATTALIESDKELAPRVREGDDGDRRHVHGHREALPGPAGPAGAGGRRPAPDRGHPGWLSELERTGDLAYNIAKLVQMEDFRRAGPQSRARSGGRTGCRRQKVLGAAIDAWATKDDALAADIALQDDRWTSFTPRS